MKKLIHIILLAAMLTAALAGTAYADEDIGVEPGQAMPDFTVSLTDGSTVTLSELLKNKDLVVLNIFASWCGPCEREFPEMENVYEENKDRMEIISVSAEPKDTMELISDYKSSHGLSFPMGLKGDSLSFLKVSSFPTTIFIDRNGNVGFIKVGAFVNRAEFEDKINVFLSQDYNGNPLASEKAVSLLPLLLGWFILRTLMVAVGRWGIFRKAGRKGWYSLIPFLSSYTEFDICWKGWLGILVALCSSVALLSNLLGLPGFVYNIILAGEFLLILLESLKLATAFGKGTVMGVLMAIPVLREVCRLILGLGKARYQMPGSNVARV